MKNKLKQIFKNQAIKPCPLGKGWGKALFLLTLGLGISSSAWGWTFDYPTVYFYTTSNDTWDKAMLFAYRSIGDNNKGSMGWNMSKIDNTQLWRVYAETNWGSSLNGFVYGIGATNDWPWESGDNWTSRWNYMKANHSHTGTSQTDLPCATFLMTSSSSSDLSVSTLSGGWGDLNKKQTVKVMISTDNGSTYTEATTTWYSNSIAVNRYTLDDASTAGSHDKTLDGTADDKKYASAVITSSVTFTASANENFTFAGWAEDADGPDDTNASYTYTVSGTKTIYAYFKENTSLVTLVGCTEASVYAGPITTGTATAKEPAGQEVTGFNKSGDEITFTGTMADKAISFNATAAGTVTAQFAYKTPAIEVASTATYTLGGAAIKLNPVYSNLAADATYSWTCTGVTPSGESGATVSDCKFSANNIANPNISADKAGTYTITLTATNGTGTGSKTSEVKTITLTASPFSGADCGTCFNYEQK